MKTPKAIKTALLILANTASFCAAEADANSGSTPVLILSLVSILLLLYSYKLHAENTRLRNEARRYRAKLAEYINTEEKREDSHPNLEQGEQKHLELKKKLHEGVVDQYAKRLYWDRLTSTLNKVSSLGEELTQLENKKRDLEEVIELTKRKYYQREIDEKSFTDIIKENEKQMIDAEAKIAKLRKKQDEDEKTPGQNRG